MIKKRPGIFILILSDFNLGLFLFLFLSFTTIGTVTLIDEDSLIGFGIVLILLAFIFFLLLVRRMNILKTIFRKGVSIEGEAVNVSISFIRKSYNNPHFKIVFAYSYNQIEYSGSTQMALSNINYQKINLLINPSKPSQWYCIDKLNQINQMISFFKALFTRNK